MTHWALCPKEYVLEEHVAKKGGLGCAPSEGKEEKGWHGLAGSFCPAAAFAPPLRLLGTSLKSNAPASDP